MNEYDSDKMRAVLAASHGVHTVDDPAAAEIGVADHLSDEPPFSLRDDSTWDTNLERGIHWGLRLIERNADRQRITPVPAWRIADGLSAEQRAEALRTVSELLEVPPERIFKPNGGTKTITLHRLAGPIPANSNYLMAEIPSNIILAEQFADHIDGFSIGSNDLTQLTLGLDRDSALVAELYDERNEAVKRLISGLIKVAKAKGVKVGICGQGPSDFPDFAAFLVEAGIDSISVTPDSVLKTIQTLARQPKTAAAMV